jgi:AraC family transcriptional regulator of adaptative response/methylated-DNA-[protein]-cysteine methyltransferase
MQAWKYFNQRKRIFMDYTQFSDDYQRVEQAILFLEANAASQPTLKEAAESIHLSEYHFQRLFTRWVGISPKRFLQYLTKENARRLLEGSASLLETAYEIGLSGPGRLHDLFIACEGVTPGEYKQRGAGLTIRYGFHPTPFGVGLLGITQRGICHLAFADPEGKETALASLKNRWRYAELIEDAADTQPWMSRVFTAAAGASHPRQGAGAPLQLYLSGTNFQLKVWEALLRIPEGYLVSYEAIAAALGQPSAARAVSNAIAHNPIAYLIPCHRVIRKDGEIGGYRYGSARKKAILGYEMAQENAQAGRDSE